MITRRMFVATGAAGTAALAAGGLAACSTGGDSGSGTDTDTAQTFTWWDPYPQHDENSDWAQRVQAAGEAAGVTIERTAYDTTALTNQALLAAQEGTSPDIILLDNPAIPTLADTGMLSTTDELGLDISHIDENLLGAGQIDGSTYGIPIGANTLALFYNLEILVAAGVDPASITDWESLDTALEAISGTDKRGITFAGINTEEGSFQFLPWFWGSGAELTDLASEEAIAALELWKSWVDNGYAPNTVITNSQNTTWEEFLTGDYGFAENGTWQVNSAAEAPFETGVIELPARDGGVAPAPTGGEFIVAPVQSDTDRYETSRTIIEAMTTPEGFVETATTFAYYIPPTDEGQQQLLEENPELETWVSAVQAARGRTSGLGIDYVTISEQLWTAVQNALSGAESPADALETAQAAADEALGA